MATPREEVILKMVDGVKVSVPRQIKHLSTFVLREQGDWFEDEIKFLRRMLQPGMKVLDIGANYGLYTLSMAKVIGGEGAVWAFEPASKTAAHLRKSIVENGFDNIRLIESGLSNRVGEATFNLASNSELNSLQTVNGGIGTESIQLTTLDAFVAEMALPNIDFIKLDAEGEESRIIEAAGTILGDMSPLIMFELKHAKKINLPLINQLANLGYKSYRLLPGLEMMMPFDQSQKPDPYQLNLFCCKDDRAELLEGQGVLVRELDGVNVEVLGRSREFLQSLPFLHRLEESTQWLDRAPTPFENMLDFYVASQDSDMPANQRLACLRRATVLSVVQTSRGGRQDVVPIEQVAVHARIALAAGQRARAVNLLVDAIGSNDGVTKLRPQMPFLPAAPRYDNIDPKDRLNRWLVSSVIEQWVVNHAYSSYFTVHKALPALKRLNTLGFINQRMKQRLTIVSSIKVK